MTPPALLQTHLPVLQVVVPLLCAPLCVLFRNGPVSWAWTLIVTGACFLTSLALLTQTLDGAVLVYELGNWPPPWGIEYRIDVANAAVLVIVSGIAFFTTPFALQTVAKEIPAERHYLFYLMYLLCLTGLLGMTATGDVFNLFVFLEISSLSTYVMISLGRDRRALTAAYRYLVMGTLGATFYIIGVGMMYMMTGSLNMADLAAVLPTVVENRTILAAFAFIIVGLGLKLAMFPLHTWLPNAYAYAPSPVTVFLAATATKVAIYALLRLIFSVFGGTDIYADTDIQDAILALAFCAVFFMSAAAIFQDDMKKMLAYSSISQVGYMVMGVGLATPESLTATIVHLFNHGVMKAGAFMTIGCVLFVVGGVTLNHMAGLGKRMPVTMAAFLIAGLSLIGSPLTVGFITKYQLVDAALSYDNWLVAGGILASSLLSIAYVWRVVEVSYFRPVPETVASNGTNVPLTMQASLWFMTGVTIWFGVDGETTLSIARLAADALVGGYR